MSRIDPIEVTTRYATTVESLTDAWAFVMEKLDSVGPRPRIEISPVSRRAWDAVEDEGWTDLFSVVVSGMVQEQEDDS